MSEQATSGEGIKLGTFELAVERFRAVAALGKSALVLEQQAEEIRLQLEILVLDQDYEVPDGKVLKVTCTQPTFPGYLKHPPILEVLEGEEGKQKWVSFASDEEKYDAIMKPAELSPQQVTYTFLGRSIEYDGDDATVWVYNDDLNARVQLTENVWVSEIDNTALASENE